jgi:hypothetical protein
MTRLISNSEVSSWQQCGRKYYFEYVLDLEPMTPSDPITKGVIIHGMLEYYYVAKSEGLDEAECREAAMEPLMTALSDGLMEVNDLGCIRDLVMGYFDRYREVDDERYKVYAVEGKFVLDLSEDYSMPGTIDLIYLDTWDNKFIIIDHKSSYNFWTDEQANISGQFPKYIAIMRAQGMPVKAGWINQIRTRPLKDGNELYRRTPIQPSDKKVAEMVRQHVQLSNEIIAYRQAPALEAAPGAYNKYVCANCSFLPLCDSAIEGVDIRFHIKHEYRQRTSYGYNPNTEISHV